MRYKILDSWGTEQSRPSEGDTAVGENPPTWNRTRMGKPRTKSATPLSKRANPWKVQTVRENRWDYRGHSRGSPRGPRGRGQALGGMCCRSNRVFENTSVVSSWVNRVSPPYIYIIDIVCLSHHWKMAPPLWSTHIKKANKQKLSAFLFFRQETFNHVRHKGSWARSSLRFITRKKCFPFDAKYNFKPQCSHSSRLLSLKWNLSHTSSKSN